MTVSSAIITSYLLEENSSKLEKIEAKSDALDQKIDNYWEYAKSAENKIDLAIIALSNSDNAENKKIVEEYFFNWLKTAALYIEHNFDQEDLLIIQNTNNTRIKQYIKIIKTFKNRIISKIDDLYIEKIALKHQRNNILEHDAKLKNAALLLQILGLILVLSKNIFFN